jgi:hypothetical protein
VVAGSLICFVLLWGIVFGQMASGNDPVLASKARAVGRRESPASRAASEAVETTEPEVETTEPEVETTEPEEVEGQLAAPEAEAVEVPVEPEPEAEPLTTGQS